MKYGCIGEHLTHSFSREIHNSLGAYEYICQEIAKEDLDRFMTEKDFCGINVTIPYKQQVIPYLDEISPRAAAIGAVNTVVNRNGKLLGYNTDYVGLKGLMAYAGIDPAGKKVLILGTGGTSKTAQAVVTDGGASSVYRVSRGGKEGALTYEEAYRDHTDASVIVNTTPVGMYPSVEGCPLDLSRFSSLTGVVDVIYNPLRSELVLAAKERGIPAIGGLYMLVRQAVAAYELFFDTAAAALTDGVYRSLSGRKENVVLMGMPSSGKTTVGQALAKRSGRTFVDTDELIARRQGKEPAVILRESGVETFRRLEQEAVASIASMSGAVIATGGGTLLRRENVRSLSKNGRFFFLDRPLELLTPTADRPLSSSPARLAALYEERLPLYSALADEVIAADGSVNECVEIIEKRMKP